MNGQDDRKAAVAVLVKPELPSAYDLVVLADGRDPVARAVERARDEVADGTLFWADRPDRLSLALLLEPEAPLAETCRVYFTFMVAAGEALGSLTAPAYPLTFRYPHTILFDGFELARLRCRWPAGTAPDGVPAWLVLGLEADIQEPAEPGEQPERITLAGAGAADVPAAAFVEALARRFLYWLQRSETQGFEPVRRLWNHRLERRGETAAVAFGDIRAAGVGRGLDDGGRFEVGGRAIALWDLPPECLA